MNSDEVDSFAAQFAAQPIARRQAREQRIQKEKRTQLSDKQRQRGAVRTAQINFRCSPEFKERLQGLQEHMGGKAKVAIADIMEEALALLATKEGYKD
jgi:hypothetical protein